MVISQIWATVKDTSPKNLTHCLLYSTVGGFVGHMPPENSYLFGRPLWVTNFFIKFSFQIIISKLVWLNMVLSFNFVWRTIFVVPFLFFFCIFGSYWHAIVVSTSEVANPLLCPVYSLWGQIALFNFNYCYNHCHISFCHSNKFIHFLVHLI